MDPSLKTARPEMTSQAIQRILIVDDEPAICWGLEKMLTTEGYVVETRSSAEDGLKCAADHPPELILLDVRLPGMDGITALAEFARIAPNSKTVIMTAFGDLETAVAAVRGKASDYLVKPFSLETARKSCLSALRSQQEQQKPNLSASNAWVGLIGSSPRMQKIFHQIALLADSDLPVLVTGETGTGKEMVAQAMHRYSARCDRALVAIAPVAFSSELVESELFGHAKGAFTGAHDTQIGWFEKAAAGTIFLDEIADLPQSTQVKLLRVLESGEFYRVGETTPRFCKARVVAATNCDLEKSVQAGRFREDLYFRLNGAHIHMPPLRERVEDIPQLCEHFLKQRGNQQVQPSISPEVISHLQDRSWRGNVRELKNLISRAATWAGNRAIAVEDFPEERPEDQSDASAKTTDPDAIVRNWTCSRLDNTDGQHIGKLYSRFLQEFEPALLDAVLDSVGGNKVKAAEILGINRSTLRDKLRNRQ